MVLFVMLYKVVLTFEYLCLSQMKASEQYFPVVRLIAPYKVVLSSKF